MANSLRDGDEEVARFFAFQDVITAVLGILILIALQLSLTMNVTMAEQGELSPASATEAQPLVTAERITHLEQELPALENKLKEMAEANRRLGKRIDARDEAPSRETLERQMELMAIELAELRRELLELVATKKSLSAKLRDQASKLGIEETQTEIEKLEKEIKKLLIQVTSLQKKLAAEKKKVKDLEKDLADIPDNENKIWFIPDLDEDDKTPVLITVSGTRIRFEMFDKPESLATYATEPHLTSSFEKGIEKYSPSTHQLNFLFKPSGAKYFEALIGMFGQPGLAKRKGFAIGYDPIDESVEVLFSTP